MPIDIPIASHPAYAPRPHDRADAAPTFVTGLLEEIRWLRRELRHEQDRADQNVRYERDRARLLALDAEQTRRRADALDREVAAKNTELITLQVRLEEMQSRLAAQQATRRRSEAVPTSRRAETKRPHAPRTSPPDRWLRPETLVSGLIGVCIGKGLAAWNSSTPADTTEQPPDEPQTGAEAPSDATGADPLTAGASPPEAHGIPPDPRAADDNAPGATPDPRAADDNASLNTTGATLDPSAAADHATPPEAPGTTSDPHAAADHAAPTAAVAPRPVVEGDQGEATRETPSTTTAPRADDGEAQPREDDPRVPLPATDAPGAMSPSTPSTRRSTPDASHAPTASRRRGAMARPSVATHRKPPLAYRTRPGLLRASGTDRGAVWPRRRQSDGKVKPRRLPATALGRRLTPRTRGPPARPPGR